MSANRAPSARPASEGRQALGRALRAFAQMLPILVAMLLLSSLLIAWLPRTGILTVFGRWPSVDVLIGAAVTALIVSWVTVGAVHVPAEALQLGRRFALTRNLLCFLSAIAIAYLMVAVLRMAG